VQESLLAMNKLRQEVELEKSRAKPDRCNFEKDLDICIRAKNNAWVISRVTRGKELYMVLEKANETLLYASDAVEKFSDRYAIGFPSLVCSIVYFHSQITILLEKTFFSLNDFFLMKELEDFGLYFYSFFISTQDSTTQKNLA